MYIQFYLAGADILVVYHKKEFFQFKFSVLSDRISGTEQKIWIPAVPSGPKKSGKTCIENFKLMKKVFKIDENCQKKDKFIYSNVFYQ